MEITNEEKKALEEGMEEGICKIIPGAKVNIIMPNQIKVIPFRIKPSLEEDNFSEVHDFLIQGTAKDAYELEIDIDSLNDLGITDLRCTCPHHTFNECNKEHRHFKTCIDILKVFGKKTESKQITSKGCKAGLDGFHYCGEDIGGYVYLCDSCSIKIANDEGNLTQGVADLAGKILQPSFNVQIAKEVKDGS